MADRVIKDPHDPDFPHGTSIGWSRKCKCQPCVGAHTYLNKLSQVRRAKVKRGEATPAFVPAGPVAAHISELYSIGVSRKTIIERTGIHGATIYNISRGRYPQIRRRTAEKIMAVGSDDVDRVNAEHLKTVAQRLVNAGYSMKWLSHACGKGDTYITKLLNPPERINKSKQLTKSITSAQTDAKLKQIEELTKLGYLVPVKGRGVRTADLNAKAS